MKPVSRLTVVDHAVECLREGIRSGRWRDRLPGERTLSQELKIARMTLVKALRRLEEEGLVSTDEVGRTRKICSRRSRAGVRGRPLRVGILTMQKLENSAVELQSDLLKIAAGLQEAGHSGHFVSFPKGVAPNKTGRLGRLVDDVAADAWIVAYGTKEVLEWFAARPEPALAWGGRCIGIPIASAFFNSAPLMREAVRELVALGHRRIVLIAPTPYRLPKPGVFVAAFLDELVAAGVRAGEYNIPDWEETPLGLASLLDSLFRVTPPTALIAVEPFSAPAIFSFLDRRGLRAPADVSVICTSPGPELAWQCPDLKPACIRDPDLAVGIRSVLRWVNGVAAGRPDKKARISRVVFERGDTIGPARA